MHGSDHAGHEPAAVSGGRRDLLGGIAAVLLGTVAGCGSDPPAAGEGTATTADGSDGPTIDADASTGSDGGTSESGAPATGAGTDRTTGGGGGSGSTGTPELDLREANVVGVEVEPSDGPYRFSVTLYHDDDGEDGYADWWQVETTEGERLGRRELLHAHGTEPFTRSETVAVPDGVSCVVVRGHDQTHGYGGQAMLVNVETGATAVAGGGADRGAVDPSGCP